MPDTISAAPCPSCGHVVDLTDPRVTVTPAVNGGYAFCPHCGGIIALDADTTKRARVARGESMVVSRPPPREVPTTPPTERPPPNLPGETHDG